MSSRSALLHLVTNIACCLVAARLLAQEPPKRVVDKTVTAAFAVLRDPHFRTDAKQRLRELRAVTDRAFDWEAMARSSLGAPWRDLNALQRTEFVTVFKELLARRYMSDIDRFEGSEEMKVTDSEQQAELSTVKTVLITSSRQQIPIDYTMRKAGPEWRVEDVTIEGISLVNHYRKTFAQYLSNKSFDQLMTQLKRKLGGPDESRGIP